MSVEFLSLAEGTLAYQRQIGDIGQAGGGKPGVVFLGGYASDMEGTKAQYLAQKCAESGLSFVRFDYRGCGQSPGKFTDGTIGLWREDTLAVLDQLTQGPQIIVGSSMGGWLGLLLASSRPERIKAFIGIAVAPDFSEELVWKNLTDKQRETLLRDGEIYDEDAPPDFRIPMTLKLIEDARAHLVFSSPCPIACPVRLLQGMRDKEVPYTYAERIAKHIASDDVQITLIKNGDHRLSTPENLDMLWQMVAGFI